MDVSHIDDSLSLDVFQTKRSHSVMFILCCKVIFSARLYIYIYDRALNILIIKRVMFHHYNIGIDREFSIRNVTVPM